jgi:hypothetical protein
VAEDKKEQVLVKVQVSVQLLKAGRCLYKSAFLSVVFVLIFPMIPKL